MALPGLFAGNQARPIAPVTASRVYFLTVDHDDSIHSMYIYIYESDDFLTANALDIFGLQKSPLSGRMLLP